MKVSEIELPKCPKCGAEDSMEGNNCVVCATPRTDAVLNLQGESSISHKAKLIKLCRQLERELDQGSVRNATDEQDAKRYRWLRDNPDAELWRLLTDINEGPSEEQPEFDNSADAWDAAIDAAIRALPDQKDD